MAGASTADDGARRFDALLLDVGQTLLATRRPVGETYAEVAARHDLHRDPRAVAGAFRRAFREIRPPQGSLRYDGDGRPFWRRVVGAALASDDPDLFEELYQLYARPDAWTLAPGALDSLDRLRAAGLRVALVSDWDLRLRPLLRQLGVLDHVDHATISCEVGHEKPDPRIFLEACSALGVQPSRAVHVGDDPDRDRRGARLAGCAGWTWGQDVDSFADLEARLLHPGA